MLRHNHDLAGNKVHVDVHLVARRHSSLAEPCEAQVAALQAASVRAWQAGVRKQRVELLLPLIGATDLDDWPGGIRQQFKAVLPMCAPRRRSADL